MIGGEPEAAGRGSTRSPSSSVQGRFRTHVGVMARVILLRLERATNVPDSDWVCRDCALVCLGSGSGKLCKWLIDKPLEPPNARTENPRVGGFDSRPWPPFKSETCADHGVAYATRRFPMRPALSRSAKAGRERAEPIMLCRLTPRRGRIHQISSACRRTASDYFADSSRESLMTFVIAASRGSPCRATRSRKTPPLRHPLPAQHGESRSACRL